MVKKLSSHIFDIGLILAVFFGVYTLGKSVGYQDGQLDGYLQGYESYYKAAYFHLVDSLASLSR